MAKDSHLQEELLAAGASAEEVRELAGLAARLGRLSAPEPFLPTLHAGWSWPHAIGLAAASGMAFFVIGGAMVAAAQTSQPGSALYPVKRASENVMMTMNPDYADSVMMHRADEIDVLAAAHSSQDMVMEQVSSYKEMAPKTHPDPATRDYCAEHLKHAASLTSGSEQRAIQDAMRGLYKED